MPMIFSAIGSILATLEMGKAQIRRAFLLVSTVPVWLRTKKQPSHFWLD